MKKSTKRKAKRKPASKQRIVTMLIEAARRIHGSVTLRSNVFAESSPAR